MVNPEHLSLGEDSANAIIYFTGGIEIRADRLFKHNARIGRGKSGPAKGFRNVHIEPRRRCQIEHARMVFIGRKLGLQGWPICIRVGGIDGHIFNQLLKNLPGLGVPALT